MSQCKLCFSTNNLGCQFCTINPYIPKVSIEQLQPMPKRFWNQNRIQDLAKSIQLYSELELSTKNIELMKTWTSEMNELLKEMK